MNIKAISDLVTSKVGRQVLQAQKHSPTIMFAGGVVGVVATVVLASKATLKVDDVLEETAVNISKAKGLRSVDHPDYSELDYNRDRTLIYAKSVGQLVKLYAPALIVGTCSVGLLTGAHITLNRRNAGLVAAYAAVDKAFKEYRGRVVDELGEDKDREFRFGATEKEIYSETKKGEPKVKRVKTAAGHSQYARFFDRSCGHVFQDTREYNLLFLQGHQNWLNDKLQARGHVFLNEAYDALGMERTTEGAVVGWVKDGDGDGVIDFGIWDDENMLRMHDFMTGSEDAILIDFNVDGVIYDKI